LLTCALKPRKLGLTIGTPGPSVNQHNTIRSLEGLTDADCAATSCGHIEGWKGLSVLQARHRGFPSTGLTGPLYAYPSRLSSPLDVTFYHGRKSEIVSALLDRPRRGSPGAYRRGGSKFDLCAWCGADEPRRRDGDERREQIAALSLLRG